MQLKDYPQLELIHIVKGLSTFLSFYDQPNVFALMMDYDIQTQDVKALAREHHCGYNTALVTLILERNLKDELKTIGAIKESEPEPQPEPVAVPDQHRIIRMERAATKNSSSPMWRCLTDSGEQVNVFKHSDRSKDTFYLFDEAGYGARMLGMQIGDVLEWTTHPIRVNMVKENGWWAVKNVPVRPIEVDPDEPAQVPDATKARNDAIQWAADLMNNPFLVFDTETTGVQDDDEIVRIAIVNNLEQVMMDQLIKPSQEGLTRLSQKDPKRGLSPQDIHGITAEMLKDAPDFALQYGKILDLLYPLPAVAYNADYDVRLLAQDCKRHSKGIVWGQFEPQCAMKQYAAFAGEWNSFQGNWKWHKLEDACKREGLEVLDAHDPVNDCRMTLALIKHMAAATPGNSSDIPF